MKSLYIGILKIEWPILVSNYPFDQGEVMKNKHRNKGYVMGWDPGHVILSVWLLGNLLIVIGCVWVVQQTLSDFANWVNDDSNLMRNVTIVFSWIGLIDLVIIFITLLSTYRIHVIKTAQQGDAPEPASPAR